MAWPFPHEPWRFLTFVKPGFRRSRGIDLLQLCNFGKKKYKLPNPSILFPSDERRNKWSTKNDDDEEEDDEGEEQDTNSGEQGS